MEHTDWNQLAIKPNEVDILIYHDCCIDSFGCVVAAEYYLRSQNSDQKIEYVPGKYDRDLDIDVAGKNILLCDISYKKDKMIELTQKAKNVLVLDHHKTAVAELSHMNQSNKVFDMGHSGAYITWVYFNGLNNIPLLIKYIQDTDIWLKKMEFTNEIHAYLSSIEKEMPGYYELLDEDVLMSKVSIGESILKQQDIDITKFLKNSYTKSIKIKDKNYVMSVSECPVYKYKSELGSRMISYHRECDFAMIYNFDEENNKTCISLRSENSRADVSEIAALYGGGGHRNASGISFNGNINGGLFDM